MDGNKFIIVASLYGFSGASQDPAIARKNDELLRAAALRCAGFIPTTYVQMPTPIHKRAEPGIKD
jgi:hypothetical protein